MMKYASAAYGWKGLTLYTNFKGDLSTGASVVSKEGNIKALEQHCGISREDVVEKSWNSKGVYCPGYYIILDHRLKSIVLAIRGTFHIDDVLTDLIASYVDFVDDDKGVKGEAHDGIAQAAQTVVSILEESLKKQLEKYPDYGIMVVGHSLGAGTAALLSILLKKKHPNFPLRCFSFAPPPVVSYNLAKECESYVHSYIFQNDVISRLSLGSLADLKSLVQDMLNKADGKMVNLFKDILNGNITDGKTIESITREELDHLPTSLITPLPESKRSKRLFVPGKIFHLTQLEYVQPGDKTIRKKVDYFAINEADQHQFTDIVLCSDMIADHFPSNYEQALTNIVDYIDGGTINIPEEEDDIVRWVKFSSTFYPVAYIIALAVGVVVYRQTNYWSSILNGLSYIMSCVKQMFFQ
eukprot:TRINITY_DN777_c0_g1_i1.p1 TRINITY_DN777_c0_g1~~TRINITY_DN777_c0_g1_i1.p1  ORF type:complete len:411 (+),score=75.28 TRINITY_DN777_c0_g1_i1:371-1603(+)